MFFGLDGFTWNDPETLAKFFSIRSEPRNILRLFLNFTNFDAHYSYKIYSYKKRV